MDTYWDYLEKARRQGAREALERAVVRASVTDLAMLGRLAAEYAEPAAPAECATYFCEKCEGQGIVRAGVAPGQVVPCPACAPGAEEAKP